MISAPRASGARFGRRLVERQFERGRSLLVIGLSRQLGGIEAVSRRRLGPFLSLSCEARFQAAGADLKGRRATDRTPRRRGARRGYELLPLH